MVNRASAFYNLGRMLNACDEVDLYVTMLNQGNLLDIEAEMRRQDAIGDSGQYGKWQRIADAILRIEDNKMFRLLRASIFQPLQQVTLESIQPLITQAKQAILSENGVPAGVDVDDISWDAVSFKIAPSCVELFCIRYPDALAKLTQPELSILEQIEDTCSQAITEKCAEYRARSETQEDEFIPDITLYLENSIAGKYDPDRSVRVRKTSKDVLRRYIDSMQSLFAAGHIPGTIPPSKVFACHDIVSATELRGAIMRLSEYQTTQQGDILNNQNTYRRAQLNANGAPGDTATKWTEAQRVSLLLKKNIDSGLRAGSKSIGALYKQPMRDYAQQISGGANTLADQVDVNATGETLRMTHEEDETLRQQLSVMLACLRIRCDAIQASAWELVTDEDFDHIEIVKHMSQVTGMNTSDEIYRNAVVLEETFMGGHQTQKFEGKALPPDLEQLVTYTIQGRVKQLLRAVPLFATDLEEGGMLTEKVTKCAFMASALKQRLSMEITDRFIRRTAIAASAYQLQ